ncbi:nitroreductase family protein [Nonomuraea sp. SYSU D8015]|uniref:nitroreductase family protein n=1 Tax=Nonomuraea sp. SYSU D8015 TaxID=2593644 RepID=UPI0016600805|nr:nitroreductase family protein [Nonomuraea sp. SYSU D8015]
MTHLFRAVPSGGAYHPSELYVSWHGSADLPAGLYYYNAIHHELVEVAGAAPLPGGKPSYLLACRVWKNSAKYGPLGYRLGCLDIGVLAGQLLALDTGNDTVNFFFDQDAIDSALALDSGVISVYAIVSEPPDGRDWIRWIENRGWARPRQIDPLHADQELADLADPEVRRLHQMAGIAKHSGSHAPAQPVVRTQTSIALPDAPPIDVAAEAIHRRSAIAFQPCPIRPDQLAALLAQAAADIPSDVMAATGEEPALSLYCVVNRVTGLEPGAYRYDPATNTLLPCGTADAPERLAVAMYAPMELTPIGAVHVFVAGPSKSATTRWHRVLHLLAGVIVQRLCLAARPVGLGARPLLGFDAADVDALLAMPSGHNTLVQVVFGTAGASPEVLELELR